MWHEFFIAIPNISPTSIISALEVSDDIMRGTIVKWQENIEYGARKVHENIPGLRKLPFPAIAIIILIAVVNVLAWIAVAIVLV